MNQLDKREIALLKQLNENPIWVSILNKFAEHNQLQRYKRGDELSDWAYASGYLDAVESILSVLIGKQVKLNEVKSK